MTQLYVDFNDASEGKKGKSIDSGSQTRSPIMHNKTGKPKSPIFPILKDFRPIAIGVWRSNPQKIKSNQIASSVIRTSHLANLLPAVIPLCHTPIVNDGFTYSGIYHHTQVQHCSPFLNRDLADQSLRLVHGR